MPLRTTRAGVGQTVRTGNGSPGHRPASKRVHEWEQQATKIQEQTCPIRASPKTPFHKYSKKANQGIPIVFTKEALPCTNVSLSVDSCPTLNEM